jgi:hypothetical protein
MTIAANRHFFHHPAEMPEVLALPGGHWFAHWVESPGGDSDAEYVYVSSSTDGSHWTMRSKPITTTALCSMAWLQ